MLQTKTITYEDQSFHVDIVVKQATLKDSFRFDALRFLPRENVEEPEDLVEKFVFRMHDLFSKLTHPALVVGTVEIHNLDPDKEQLTMEELPLAERIMELPQALVDMWEEAVLELNPTWSPFAQMRTTKSSSTENSSTGTDENPQTQS